MTIQFPSEQETTAVLAGGKSRVLRKIHVRQRAARVAVVGGVLLAASCGTGAFFAVQASQEEIQTGVVCYSHDDLGSLSSTGSMVQPDGKPLKPVSLQTKQEMCGLAWRGGLKEAAANGGRWPDVDPNTSTIPIPPLAFCLQNNGVTAGFPIEAPSRTPAEVCDRLGLALLG